MLLGFFCLLVFQFLGEALVVWANLPIPGPVMGMLLLLGTLVINGGVPELVRTPAEGLIQHLSLLFIPAGVGLMMHLNVLRQEGWIVASALIGSTFAAMFVTALLLKWLIPAPKKGHPPHE